MLRITPALIDTFAKNLTEREYSPATISKYAHDARALMEYAPDGITDKAQLVGFRSWLEQRGYSGASVNSMLGAVNALLVYIGTDWRLKYVRVQRRAFLPPDRELSQTEYERMVRVAEQQGDRRLSLLVQTLCALGLRVSELKAITVESLASGEASIRNKGKLRTILIPDALAKKVFPHNLRHLFARTHYRKFKDIVRLADILGHSSIDATRIYTMHSGKEERRQLGQLRLIL